MEIDQNSSTITRIDFWLLRSERGQKDLIITHYSFQTQQAHLRQITRENSFNASSHNTQPTNGPWEIRIENVPIEDINACPSLDTNIAYYMNLPSKRTVKKIVSALCLSRVGLSGNRTPDSHGGTKQIVVRIEGAFQSFERCKSANRSITKPPKKH